MSAFSVEPKKRWTLASRNLKLPLWKLARYGPRSNPGKTRVVPGGLICLVRLGGIESLPTSSSGHTFVAS